jgi:putative endonuclease
MYVLRCRDGSLYCGVAYSVSERVKKHRDGKGSKYVRSRLPVHVVLTETYSDMREAQRVEATFKSMRKADKEEAVRRAVKRRGIEDAMMDDMENTPWQSIGGNRCRKPAEPRPPVYIPIADKAPYLEGYVGFMEQP